MSMEKIRGRKVTIFNTEICSRKVDLRPFFKIAMNSQINFSIHFIAVHNLFYREINTTREKHF